MSSGFYELLGVAPAADAAAVRAAYQEQVAHIVRKLRAAEARQQDTAPLEARRASLAEAWAVVSHPVRRRRYDRFRELAASSFPTDLDELWRAAGPSMVDPAAAAALELVRTLTTLKVGDTVGTDEEEELELEPTVPASDARLVAGEASAPPAATPAAATTPTPSPTARPWTSVAAVDIDRSVPMEEVHRLLDVYGPTGAWLQAVREVRKLDIDALAAATKVNRRFLEAMEAERWDVLPAATFVRGYLRTVLRVLAVPGSVEETEEVVEGYMARFHRARG